MDKRNQTKVVFGFIIIFSLLLLLILPLWNVEIIEYDVTSDQPYYSQRDIEIVMGITENTHILNITSNNVEQCMEKLPFIESMSIEKIFPNKLKIKVTERIPLGYISFSGSYLLISTKAVVIAEQRERFYSLPLIEGVKVEQFSLGQPLTILNDEHMLALELILNEFKKYDIVSNITNINIGNLEQIHLYIGKLNVIIGNIDDFDKKIAWLNSIYQEYTVGVLDLSNVGSDSGSSSAVLRPLE
ncbi:MAG: hypothetical protein ATN34_05485 [Epulopiscium sp. Nele67-Bin002]|nr:MAG: hypothetical protein BEN18_03690 [Epulopiscium sp. Nuni2H_MBin001]OON91487.1 MAG: hypothetical protein ATN34_05485 [Epulopiscium sp. Nele67-Bin002]OON93478.1 MAG: hypothetical protein ATN33_05720 [Epulopiscium sp. Nele67-Bin001]